MKKLNGLTWCGIGGSLLGLLTAGLIGFAGTWHQCGPVCVEITDIASVPAFLIARIFYPEVVHTGHGRSEWGVVFLAAGALFYAAVWFIILWLVTRRRRRVATQRTDIR